MLDAIVLSAVVSIESDWNVETEETVATVAEDGVCPFKTEQPPMTSERIVVIVINAVFLFIFSRH